MREMNTNPQIYNDITLQLINRKDYPYKKAKRFVIVPPKNTIAHTNQNIWIPNIYLEQDGTIKQHAKLDFIFRTAQTKRKLTLAGYKGVE